MVDRIFYINLAKRKDRNDHMISILKEQNLWDKSERIEAVYGRDLTLNDIKELVKENILKPKIVSEIEQNQKTYLSYPEIGCAVSHINIWKKMVKENIAEALILEDDATIANNFMANLNQQKKHYPKNYDIIFLGYNIQTFFRLRNSEYPNLKKTKNLNGTHGYLITYHGAKRLLEENFLPLEKPFDVHIGDKMDQFNIYLVPILDRLVFAPVPLFSFELGSDILTPISRYSFYLGILLVILVIAVVYIWFRRNKR